MTEKNKQRLLATGLIVLALIILWLLLRGQSTQAATTTPTVETNQSAGQLPTSNGSIGPLTYNIGGPGGINIVNPGVNIPSLAGLTMPSFNLPAANTTSACCSSCGCDATSPLNQFAAGVGSALSNYASEMTNLETNYQQSLFGLLPQYISQYVSSAAPSTPVSVI